MRIALSIVKWLAGLLVLALLAIFLWLWFAPPELIRVGSNYSAKITCSNVFLAGRDPEEVLAQDVQAPGHPLLRLMQVDVDAGERTVRAGLFGHSGGGLAVFRNGTGCAAVPDGNVEAARGLTLEDPASAANTDPWPQGNHVETSTSPALTAILDDPAMTRPGMRAIVVVQDGRIIGERRGEGVSDDQPLLGWSMTKAVTAAVVGTLVREGKLSIEDKNLFPEWTDDSRAEITLAHLLGMESGLAFNENYGGVTDVTRMLYLEPDMAAFAADQPLLYRPGEHFSYSSGSSVLVSRVWQNSFQDEQSALEWPRRALFGPLGMNSALLETDARGTFAGSSYLYASARDWARFGQLLLQEGIWQGRKVLPERWVEWMRTPTHASNGKYGRGIWLHGPRVNGFSSGDPDAGYDLPDDAYWLIGHDGQTITVIPSRQLVVLRMGLTPTNLAYRPQALVEAVLNSLEKREID